MPSLDGAADSAARVGVGQCAIFPAAQRAGRLSGAEKGRNVVRSGIPAVTRVDYPARIQTVNHEQHAPISRFGGLTGCPIAVNTSFNVRGEPVVRTPRDAFLCFMGAELDVRVCGDAVLRKDRQPAHLKQTCEDKNERD